MPLELFLPCHSLSYTHKTKTNSMPTGTMATSAAIKHKSPRLSLWKREATGILQFLFYFNFGECLNDITCLYIVVVHK